MIIETGMPLDFKRWVLNNMGRCKFCDDIDILMEMGSNVYACQDCSKRWRLIDMHCGSPPSFTEMCFFSRKMKFVW